MSETFIFTPVIHGAHNSTETQSGKLLSSVHVGVRLAPSSATETVASFPTFSHWPSNIPTFQIQLGNGAPIHAQGTSSAQSLELWETFCPATMPVRDYPAAPSLSGNSVWFDAGSLTGSLQTAYASAALLTLQPIEHPLPQPEPIRINPSPFSAEETLRISFSSIGTEPAPEPIRINPSGPFTPNPIMLSAQQYFQPTTPPVSAPPPSLPTDAHDLIAYLHETPAVLRTLNLVLEIQADWDGNISEQGTTIQLVANFPSGLNPQKIFPVVALSAADLQAAGGFEPPAGLQAIPYDPIHAVHAYARHSGGALPALRSSGMSLMLVPARTPAGTGSGNLDLAPEMRTP
jgi:hypothetical protein